MPVVRVIRREARQTPTPTPTPAAPLTDPLEVVTPAEMRRQLRLPADTGDNDPYTAIVETAIRSAVAFVAANTTVPLLDKAVSYQVVVASDRGYLTVPVAYIKSVTRVRFWSESQGYGAEPAGEVIAVNLGRVVIQDRNAYVYPPTTDGWPVRRAGSPLLVDVVRGVTVDPDHVLFQAVIIAGREFFHGFSEIPRNHAVYALMASVP